MAKKMRPSSAVIAANERLYALRRNSGAARERSQCECATVSHSTPPPVVTFPRLPEHLGWSSHQLTAHMRKRHALPKVSVHTNLSKIIPPEDAETTNETKDRTAVSHQKHIRHHPDLGIAALKADEAPQFRIWLILRHLNLSGSGQLSQQEFKQPLTAKESPLRMCGWRRLRQILHRGHGRFWTYNPLQKRLWLYGTVRVAKHLQVSRLSGQPIQLPIDTLTDSIGLFKAHLFSAWHSGRNGGTGSPGQPISRQTQEKLTQVPQRTQRHYEKQAGVQTITNLAVGAAYTGPNIENFTWKKGCALFQFVDKNGRLGKRNGRYIAWQMPNSYTGPHAVASSKNHRRINRQLIDLVQKGAQGNDGLSLTRRYFPDGRTAAKALSSHNSHSNGESYWPLPIQHRNQLWSVFFN